MRTISQSMGIATSTVSRALRDDATISVAVRNKIKRAARLLGYRPNPLVSTLMAQLHVQRRRIDPYHIAWIDLWPSDNASSQLLLFKPLLQGAKIRARELGYGIEVHKPAQSGIEPARLRQILFARSQWGIVIPPVPEAARHYPLEVEGFAVVTVGTSLRTPAVHRVSPDLYQGCQLACSKLREKGFHRIGLVLSQSMNQRVEGKWLGAYLAEQQLWPAPERLHPVLFTEGMPAQFSQWLFENNPDAILLAEVEVETWAGKYRSANRRSPNITWLLLEQKDRRKQGINYRGSKIGAAAIEFVVGQIHRNERGSATIPSSFLMPGVWVGNH